MNIHRRGHPSGPSFERIQLSFRKYGAFNARDELSKRADVHADGFATCGDCFDERGASTNMGIEHEIAGLCEGLDSGGCEDWGEPGGVFVEPMGESAHRRGIARSIDQRRLSVVG